ncbi:MAG: hypothetical protein KDK38_03215 [Leptospiraceae bacterium]|nr:hypothetical protein [Leptospiraceae bacterium]
MASAQKLEKAAKMLLALGPERAAEVLRHLDSESVEKLALIISQTPSIDAKEADSLLSELQKEIKKQQTELRGGKETALEYLKKTLGEEEASAYIDRLQQAELHRNFKEVEEYPPESVAQALKTESAQMVALTLAQLTPVFAAKVLKETEPAKRGQIAARLARLGKVSPEILQKILESLLSRLETMETQTWDDAPGEEKLSEILGFLDADLEKNLLESLESEDPDMAERVRSRLFMFEDLIQLKRDEIRRIIESVDDPNVWARALKGVDNELQRHVMSSVSANRAADLHQLMDEIGPILKAEAERYRRIIMHAVEDLDRDGEIFLHRDREDLVE